MTKDGLTEDGLTVACKLCESLIQTVQKDCESLMQSVQKDYECLMQTVQKDCDRRELSSLCMGFCLLQMYM